MKAYKVFNSDWTCRGYQYEVGKTFSMEEKPVLCRKGFHACKKVSDCFTYYIFDPSNKVAEVELLGDIIGQDEDKQVTNKIKIIKELKWEEMLILANSGNSNSGHSNSGNSNSGHSNSGHYNSGDINSGHCNSGDINSGDYNSGHRNSGDKNSGHKNSGDRNSGHKNSGDKNSGDKNSGDKNSGDKNSGHKNSGDNNSGDSNSGDSNSGNWNSTDKESGYFNSEKSDKIRIFNKWCLISTWEDAEKPYFIYNVDLTEKVADESGYYLKTLTYKEAWKVAYKRATKKDIKLLKSLPNFNKKVFKEITGIDVE